MKMSSGKVNPIFVRVVGIPIIRQEFFTAAPITGQTYCPENDNPYTIARCMDVLGVKNGWILYTPEGDTEKFSMSVRQFKYWYPKIVADKG